jgi:hypothetical protein
MSKNIQFPSEIESNYDAIQFFNNKKKEGHNINITKIGEEQYEIEVPGKGKMHLNSNCRKLPKEQRNFLKFCLFCFGFLGAAALLLYPIWFPIASKLFTG